MNFSFEVMGELINSGKPIFPGTSGVDQLVEIVKVLGIIQIHSKYAGLFVGYTDIKKNISKGELIGKVVSAKNDQTLQEVTASESGFLFTIREHPLVYPGSLLGRIAKDTVT